MGNIITGYFMQDTCGSPTTTGALSTQGSILFSPESPVDDKFSPSFIVQPGRTIFIDAYNMPLDKPIYINRLVRSTYNHPTGETCPPCNLGKLPGQGAVITYKERMTLGCSLTTWTLFKPSSTTVAPRTQMLISIPGSYELELDSLDMIGELFIRYIEWSNDLNNNFPEFYYPGRSCYTGA